MEDRVGRQLGNYHLVRFLGKGGFSDVYLAEHVFLNKFVVAIKILRERIDREDVEDFRTHAERLKHFNHPHIIKVYDYGVAENTEYLVMEYAPKGTLRERYPAGVQVPLSTVVSYTKQVASALQYMHDNKLVYRDVKPANMLLGEDDQVLLCDFDILALSQTLALIQVSPIGTIAYMAPEQISGKISRSIDQYALGVVVYEWLTGGTPFSGPLTQIFQQHMLSAPPLLSYKVPYIPKAVENVVLKSLAKDPKDRFPSVSAFAAALEEAASPAGFVPPQISSPTLLGSLLTIYHNHEDHVTSVSWSPDGTRIASSSYDQTVQIWDTLSGEMLLTYRGHKLALCAISWSPDGTHLASGGLDKFVQIWDARTGKHTTTYRGHSGWVRAVAWSPDGTRVASAGDDQTVQIWEATNGNICHVCYCGHVATVSTLAWSPDGNNIATAGKDNTVQIWEANTGKRTLHYLGHQDEIHSVVWSPDGSYVSSGSKDGTVQIMETVNGKCIQVFKEQEMVITALAWSPNGVRLAAGSLDHKVRIWDMLNNQQVFTYAGHQDEVSAVAWSPESKRIASSARDGTVQVWQAVGQELKDAPSAIRTPTIVAEERSVQWFSPGPPTSPPSIAQPPQNWTWSASVVVPKPDDTFFGPPAVGNIPPVVPPMPSMPVNPTVGNIPRMTPPPVVGGGYGTQAPPFASENEPSEKSHLSLFAVARSSLEEDDKAFTEKIYTVQAGMSQNEPSDDFEGDPFEVDITRSTELIPFEISIHASENIELITEWYQTLLYDPQNMELQFVEFLFKAVTAGQSFLVIDFHYKCRWLRTVRLAFDIIEEPGVIPVGSV